MAKHTTKLSAKKNRYDMDIREYIISGESQNKTRLCEFCNHTTRSRDVMYPIAVDIEMSQLFGYNNMTPLLNGIAVYCPHCDNSYLLNEFGHVIALRENESPYTGEVGSYEYPLPVGYNSNRSNIPLGDISFESPRRGLVEVVEDKSEHYYYEKLDMRPYWIGIAPKTPPALCHVSMPDMDLRLPTIMTRQKFETDNRHEYLGLSAVEGKDYRELLADN